MVLGLDWSLTPSPDLCIAFTVLGFSACSSGRLALSALSYAQRVRAFQDSLNVAAVVAKVKNVSLAELDRVTTENVGSLFAWRG